MLMWVSFSGKDEESIESITSSDMAGGKMSLELLVSEARETNISI